MSGGTGDLHLARMPAVPDKYTESHSLRDRLLDSDSLSLHLLNLAD
jgi:hypothetical protein